MKQYNEVYGLDSINELAAEGWTVVSASLVELNIVYNYDNNTEFWSDGEAKKTVWKALMEREAPPVTLTLEVPSRPPEEQE